MSTPGTSAALPQHIEQLLKERQQHVDDIATIDATLGRVTVALGGTKAAPAAVASKPAATTSAPAAASAAPKARRGRKGSAFGMTAAESVLSFVKSNKNPSTQDVNKYWKGEGRIGNADNTLSILTKAKKLKRSPLPGGVRGSRYALA